MKEIIRHLPTKGVVLRYTNFNEADRMLTLFSRSWVRYRYWQGAVERQKPFSRGHRIILLWRIHLYRRGDFHIMTQANILDSFMKFEMIWISSYMPAML